MYIYYMYIYFISPFLNFTQFFVYALIALQMIINLPVYSHFDNSLFL